MAMPRKMKTPRPPPPIAAAIVAVPMVVTVAIRSPATIEGMASGNSTWRRICAGRHPHRDGRFPHRAIHPENPRQRVAQNRQQRVESERENRRAFSDADQRHEEPEQRETGDCLSDIRDAEDPAARAGPAGQHDRRRQPDRRRRRDRDGYELKVLERERQDFRR